MGIAILVSWVDPETQEQNINSSDQANEERVAKVHGCICSVVHPVVYQIHKPDEGPIQNYLYSRH